MVSAKNRSRPLAALAEVLALLEASDERGAVPCACAVDEALGLAIALRCAVHVEAAVWEAAARTPKYGMQRGRLRISVPEEEEQVRAGG